MTGLITQGDAAVENPGSHAVWRFALFGMLGALTLPVFILPYLLAAFALVLERRLRLRLLIGVVGSGIIVVVWYLPMLSEIVASSSQQFGVEVPWHGFATLSVTQLVSPIFRLLLPGVPDITLGFPQDPPVATVIWQVIGWSLIAIGALTLWRAKLRNLLALLAFSAFGTYLVIGGLGWWVATRHVSYLSLPLFVFLALGVHTSVYAISGNGKRVAMAVLAGVAVWAIVSLYPVADRLIHVPLEALKDAAELANGSGTDLVVTNSTRPEGFQYYLETAPTVLTPAELEELFCDEDRTSFVFLDQPFKAEEVDTSCLEAKGASRIRLEQRGRGYLIDVWSVGLP
jgi:hypothetical protein